MRFLLFILLIIFSATAASQELFVFTEPASNMAAKSVGFRLNNSFMKERFSSKTDYGLIPEIMVGVSRRIMVHGDAFFGNTLKNFGAEGGSIYTKYRFFNNDEVQMHFRMAAFARASFNNTHIHEEAINIYGHNSGIEGGIVATQLLHKIALSSSASYIKATDNGIYKFPYGESNSKAINYTFSFGKLMLPKEYKNYDQVNLNLMFEFLSQYNLGSKKYFIDAAPSLQLIINSQSRIDVGYRKELYSTLFRISSNSFFIRLEHNLFNAW